MNITIKLYVIRVGRDLVRGVVGVAARALPAAAARGRGSGHRPPGVRVARRARVGAAVPRALAHLPPRLPGFHAAQ